MENNNKFELFKDVGKRNKVYISITKSKSFGLPRSFIDKYGITDDHHLAILFNKQDSPIQLLLLFTSKEQKFTYSVRVPNNKHGGMVAAKSFFDSTGISAEEFNGRYYDIEEVQPGDYGIQSDGKAFILNLTRKELDETTGSDDASSGDAVAESTKGRSTYGYRI